MTTKSINRRIYILLIIMGMMGIVSYYCLVLLDCEDHIIPHLIVMQIIYNVIAANAIVRMLKYDKKNK